MYKIKKLDGKYYIELVGQIFGDWLVLEKDKADKIKNGARFICRCNGCGLTKSIRSSHLRGGDTNSCRKCMGNKMKGDGHNLYNGYKDLSMTKFNAIKKGALSRNLEFCITIEYVWDLFIKQNSKCAISGLPITLIQSNLENKGGKATASLDRKDSKKGYIKGNVQWVHKHINKMKSAFIQDYFINMCHAVSKNNRTN